MMLRTISSKLLANTSTYPSLHYRERFHAKHAIIGHLIVKPNRSHLACIYMILEHCYSGQERGMPVLTFTAIPREAMMLRAVSWAASHSLFCSCDAANTMNDLCAVTTWNALGCPKLIVNRIFRVKNVVLEGSSGRFTNFELSNGSIRLNLNCCFTIAGGTASFGGLDSLGDATGTFTGIP